MKRLAVVLSFLLVPSALAAPLRAIVLDTEDKSISSIDASTATVATRVALTDTPRTMILSPDGKRIAVLSRGEGTQSFWTSHFNPTTKSSVTIVDAASMKSIGRAELGWDLGRAAFSRDGATLTVLTPGISSKKPNEVKAAELIRVDAKSGAAMKRIALDRPAESFDVSSNGNVGAIFFKGKPAEVRLVDLDSLDTVATIPLSNDTDAAAALINDRIYYVDNANAKNGKMYVVSLPSKSLAATLDLVRSSACRVCRSRQRHDLRRERQRRIARHQRNQRGIAAESCAESGRGPFLRRQENRVCRQRAWPNARRSRQDDRRDADQVEGLGGRRFHIDIRRPPRICVPPHG